MILVRFLVSWRWTISWLGLDSAMQMGPIILVMSVRVSLWAWFVPPFAEKFKRKISISITDMGLAVVHWYTTGGFDGWLCS